MKFARFASHVAGLSQTAVAKVTAVTTVVVMSAASHATGSDPISTVLDSVDLTGIATKIAAVALIIVTVALTFKGPDIAKRVIRKV